MPHRCCPRVPTAGAAGGIACLYGGDVWGSRVLPRREVPVRGFDLWERHRDCGGAPESSCWVTGMRPSRPGPQQWTVRPPWSAWDMLCPADSVAGLSAAGVAVGAVAAWGGGFYLRGRCLSPEVCPCLQPKSSLGGGWGWGNGNEGGRDDGGGARVVRRDD